MSFNVIVGRWCATAVAIAPGSVAEAPAPNFTSRSDVEPTSVSPSRTRGPLWSCLYSLVVMPLCYGICSHLFSIEPLPPTLSAPWGRRPFFEDKTSTQLWQTMKMLVESVRTLLQIARMNALLPSTGDGRAGLLPVAGPSL